MPFRGVRRRRRTDDIVTSDDPFAEDRAVRRRVLDDARDYALVMSKRAFFCGRTAAVLGRNAGERQLVRLGDALVRVPRGERGLRLPEERLCTVEQLADAVWPEHRVIAEVESDHHRTSRSQWAHDIEKHRAYAALGFEVVRLTSAHIRHPHPLAVPMVRDALRRGGWSSAR